MTPVGVAHRVPRAARASPARANSPRSNSPDIRNPGIRLGRDRMGVGHSALEVSRHIGDRHQAGEIRVRNESAARRQSLLAVSTPPRKARQADEASPQEQQAGRPGDRGGHRHPEEGVPVGKAHDVPVGINADGA